MRKAILAAAAAALLAVPAGTLQAQAPEADAATSGSWIHVSVDEADGAKVRVNLPVSLAEVAAETAGKEAPEAGRIDWDSHGDVSLEDIRRVWRELRDAGDTDLVEVREDGEHVRVVRRGDRVLVHVTEDDAETVRVEMPVDLVDAVLGTEGESLDLPAAMRKLVRSGHGELVRVHDNDTRVRIWIDDRSTQGS
jgi:hypothetical protein